MHEHTFRSPSCPELDEPAGDVSSRGPSSTLSACVLALVLATPLHAQRYHKLSGPLTRRGSTVQSWVLTPDGSRAVVDWTSFTSRAILSTPLDGASPVSLTSSLPGFPQAFALSSDGSRVVVLDRSGVFGAYQYRLYSVSVTGGTPVLLSAASGPTILSFQITPSGARVVYLVRASSSPQRDELWSAPMDGSAPPVMLNEPLTPGGSVQHDYRISPGGARVLYRADQDTDGVTDLYSVPPDRSLAPVRLNNTQAWADVADFQISFDNFSTVYLADQDTDGKLELYITSTLGGTMPVKRSGPLVAGGNVISFQLASADHRLVFRADAEEDERIELYALDPTVPGARVKLSGTLPSDQDVLDARVSPDGLQVAYRSNQDPAAPIDLYGVPATGSAAPIQLDGLFDLAQFSDYRIDGSTGRVLFHRDMGLGSKQLYSVPIDGSTAAVRLNGELVELGNAALMEARSDVVLFTADTGARLLFELFRTSIDGSTTPVRLFQPTVSGSWVKEARVTSDGTRVVFQVSNGPSSGYADELHCAPLADGESTQLSGLEPDPASLVLGSVHDMAFSSDGVHALYLAEQEPAYVRELYGVRLDGTGSPVRLSSTIGDSIQEFVTSLDGRRVVYRIGAPVSDLRSARVDSAGSEVVIERDSTAFDGLLESVQRFVLAPDRESVVYSVASGQDTLFKRGLLDGSEPPTALLTWPGAAEPHLSPDGSWIVFESPSGLYGYPLDGHQAPQRLDLAGVDFDGVAFTPDSSRVLFCASGGADDGLFVALVDGSQPAIRLGGHPLGTDARFEFTGDGTEVLFLADMGQGSGGQLYRVPVDGSVSPTWLSDGSAGPVEFFQIDPSSGRAVFSTHITFSGHLYSVPIQGGVPPTHLASGNIWGLAESPVRFSQGRVVYMTLSTSCADYSDTLRLYSVPVDGGQVPRRLDHADCAEGVYAEVELTNFGRTVLCAFQPSPSVRSGLYGAPIDGSSSARRMEGPLFADPDFDPDSARSFRTSPDGEYVLCRSAPESYLTRELFALRLHPRARRR